MATGLAAVRCPMPGRHRTRTTNRVTWAITRRYVVSGISEPRTGGTPYHAPRGFSRQPAHRHRPRSRQAPRRDVGCARRAADARQTAAGSSGEGWPCDVGVGARAARVRGSRHTTGDGSLSGTKARAITSPLHPALHPATNSAVFPGPTHAVSRVPPPHDGHGAPPARPPL